MNLLDVVREIRRHLEESGRICGGSTRSLSMRNCSRAPDS